MVDEIVTCMASNNDMSDIQRIQTEHRVKLAEFWGVKAGARVLEIGCGQGDTTAVLAHFVKENGFVHGVDIGSRAYGAPITLGESADYIMRSALGKQVKMEFEIDILASEVEFPINSFDYIVLSHCSWYLESHEALLSILKKIRKWGKQLCFAEWDTNINTIEQYPHVLAVLIQAQYESFKQTSEANVRTLFTPSDIRKLASEAGWKIENEDSIYSPKLQDGEWEVGQVLSEFETELNHLNDMPEKLASLIKSEVSILKDHIQKQEMKPLSTFTFTAR
ncbi:class I SAM-dependent methyltransferase [Ornithinibacillus salinisoli]|uniref:Class I SAM-dependent methyltransferase n=1 Tax=Ornithinibacillus salinisoli TaxID=1848459 RepID=A0ABW4VWT9_9BACI